MRSKWMQSLQWTERLTLVGFGISPDRFRKYRRASWSLRQLSTTSAMMAGSVSSMRASQARMLDSSSGDSSGRDSGCFATATVATVATVTG